MKKKMMMKRMRKRRIRRKMIMIIDNYDSFTYNLYQYIGETEPDVVVVRNDMTDIDDIKEACPSHIVISPGPGHPADAGISVRIVRELAGRIPILGICLGHQAIGEAYGAAIGHAHEILHGKVSRIKIDNGCRIFGNLPESIDAGRYHSLIVGKENLPGELAVTAVSENGEIMGLRHLQHHVYGLQFHPESVLTPYGKTILRNFLGIGEDGR